MKSFCRIKYYIAIINYLLYSVVGTHILLEQKVVLSMQKLSKKNNITVKFENMPNSILGIYVEVFEKPYIILNDILHSDMHDFIFLACYWFKGKETVGKITMKHLESRDFMPIIYARKMCDKLVC